jgi:hypothetical protein
LEVARHRVFSEAAKSRNLAPLYFFFFAQTLHRFNRISVRSGIFMEFSS